MIWFKRHSYNPNRHPEMPIEYPWQAQTSSPDETEGWESVNTQEEFDALVSSIDLSNYNHAISEEASVERQNSQRVFGQELATILIDKMGARNIDLSKAGISANVISLAQNNAAIKLLIETGALTTALGAIAQVRSDYPNHEDIYEWAYNSIYEFLTSRGYL